MVADRHIRMAEGAGHGERDQNRQELVGRVDVHVHGGFHLDRTTRLKSSEDIDIGLAELERDRIEVNVRVLLQQIRAGDEGLVQRQGVSQADAFLRVQLRALKHVDGKVALCLIESKVE